METSQRTQIFDTSVFVDYLRGREEAKSCVLNALGENVKPVVSIITIVELWAGVKDKKDERRHKAILLPFKRIPIYSAIAYRAGELAGAFYRKGDRGISIPDFIIAATAEFIGADIVTRDKKDFQKINLKNVNLILYNLE